MLGSARRVRAAVVAVPLVAVAPGVPVVRLEADVAGGGGVSGC